MPHLLANDRDGDPAYPERYPHRYVSVSCAQCQHCIFDRRAGRCLSGGPYAPDLKVSFDHVRNS
jgi:hypothetical protein